MSEYINTSTARQAGSCDYHLELIRFLQEMLGLQGWEIFFRVADVDDEYADYEMTWPAMQIYVTLNRNVTGHNDINRAVFHELFEARLHIVQVLWDVESHAEKHDTFEAERHAMLHAMWPTIEPIIKEHMNRWSAGRAQPHTDSVVPF